MQDSQLKVNKPIEHKYDKYDILLALLAYALNPSKSPEFITKFISDFIPLFDNNNKSFRKEIKIPSAYPTADPSVVPTADPSVVPTADPSVVPTADPIAVPTAVPTAGYKSERRITQKEAQHQLVKETKEVIKVAELYVVYKILFEHKDELNNLCNSIPNFYKALKILDSHNILALTENSETLQKFLDGLHTLFHDKSKLNNAFNSFEGIIKKNNDGYTVVFPSEPTKEVIESTLVKVINFAPEKFHTFYIYAGKPTSKKVRKTKSKKRISKQSRIRRRR
jgi:hypothetical protein